jgi:hypothetical protein
MQGRSTFPRLCPHFQFVQTVAGISLLAAWQMTYYLRVQRGAPMRGLVICLFFGLAGPALADITAVYERPAAKFKMTVEIATNGDVRGDITGKPGVYCLTRNGQGYFVIQTSSGVLVDRVEDEGAAVKIVAEKRLNPSFLALMKSAGPAMANIGHLLTKGDDVVVQGRKGAPYYFAGPRRPEIAPVVVMSSDPELAPLGAAMAHQFAMSDNLQFVAAPNPFNLEVETIMRSGAPIEFAGAELTTVSHDPIPPSRFELPASAESREDIIKRIDATATDQRVTAF